MSNLVQFPPASECNPVLPVKLISCTPMPGVTTALFGYGEKPEQNMLVPAVNPHYQFDIAVYRLLHYAWQQAWQWAPKSERWGVQLFGPPGTGKTSSVAQFCAMTGTPLASIEASEETDIESLIQVINVREGSLSRSHGALRRAMEGGYPFVINEWDHIRPGQITKLFQILESGTYMTDQGDLVVAKRGFLLVLTANTNGSGDVTDRFRGAREHSPAVSRRVKTRYLDFASAADEHSFLKAATGMSQKVLQPFVKVAEDIRRQWKAGISGAMGTTTTVPISAALARPQLLAWIQQGVAYLRLRVEEGVALTDPTEPWIDALDETFAASLPPSEAEAVRINAKTTISAIAAALATELIDKRKAATAQPATAVAA